jgi:hypothetical protein
MLSSTTSAPGGGHHPLDEVLLAVVDEHLGAEVGAGRQLLRRPGRHGHDGADRPTELDGHRPDPG